MSRRPIGFATLLPLYLAAATALGFVDFHVRTHPDRSYQYSAGVVAGTEDPPGRYRILAPYAFEGLSQLTGLADSTSWILFRWLCLFAALCATHLLLTSWFTASEAAAGNVLLAAMLPLTFTNSWANPDQFTELLLVTLACACIVRSWNWALAVVLALSAFNRETSAFLVLLFLVAGPLEKRRLIWAAGLAALWLAIAIGLRLALGFVPYNPWQAGQNIRYLGLLGPGYDVYYRAYAWFVVVLLVPLIWISARQWRLQPKFVRAATAIVVPLYLVVAFLFTSIIETRVFTILLPMLIPGVMHALFAARD